MEANITMGPKEIRWAGRDRTQLAKDRHKLQPFVDTEINSLVPQNARNFCTNCRTVSFSRRTFPRTIS